VEILGAILGWFVVRVAALASLLILVGCQGDSGANDPVVSAEEFKQKTAAQRSADEPSGPGAGAAKGAGGR
jgi:hypothetical protein